MRQREPDGFDRWVDLVKAEAQKYGRVFMLECIEGHDRNDNQYNDGLEVQELSGWLMTPSEAEKYQVFTLDDSVALHEQENRPDFVWVTWKMDGNKLLISFEVLRGDDYIPMIWDKPTDHPPTAQ